MDPFDTTLKLLKNMKKDYMQQLYISESDLNHPDIPDVSYCEGKRDTLLEIIVTLNEKIDYINDIQGKEKIE